MVIKTELGCCETPKVYGYDKENSYGMRGAVMFPTVCKSCGTMHGKLVVEVGTFDGSDFNVVSEKKGDIGELRETYEVKFYVLSEVLNTLGPEAFANLWAFEFVEKGEGMDAYVLGNELEMTVYYKDEIVKEAVKQLSEPRTDHIDSLWMDDAVENVTFPEPVWEHLKRNHKVKPAEW